MGVLPTGAASQTRVAPTATTKAGLLPMGSASKQGRHIGAAAQADVALTITAATTQAEVASKGAAVQAGGDSHVSGPGWGPSRRAPIAEEWECMRSAGRGPLL